MPSGYTIAELRSDSSYATSLWGKWHLGEDEGRVPTDQGLRLQGDEGEQQ
jgi:arylsulfatase A-like enzyme